MIANDPFPRTSTRPSWEELPPAVRKSAGAALGSPVVRALPQVGGFSPGLAVRATLADGPAVFLKGIETGHPAFPMYANEAAINRSLPTQAPVPRMLDSWQAGGWLLMAFDDISGGHPDLGPGSADLPAVIRLLDELPNTVDPSPIPDAPPAAGMVQGGLHGWRLLANEHSDLAPWCARHLEQLAAIEQDWPANSAGNCLLHADLRADNMLMHDGNALAIDWAYLYQAAAWIDAAFLVPQLIRAGHTPSAAEALMTEVTSWRNAPLAAVTSFAAALGGYWERSSRLPAPPGAPYLRGYQGEMAAVARRWIEHRTGWV